MRHSTTIIFLFSLITLTTLYSCSNDSSTSIRGVDIDSTIKSKAENNFSKSEFGDNFVGGISVYKNKLFADLFKDDSLAISTFSNPVELLFKSFYYWTGDTLGIDGAFGLFGGMGFSIKIVDNSATLYHLLSSDDFPTYAYSENDTLIYRLEVPCKRTRIVLSAMPDSINKPTIFGYVEFASNEYFESSGSAEGNEILPKSRQRANMKIFFKSTSLALK